MSTDNTSLLALITAALTATDCGPQRVKFEFDAEKHHIVGDVPMAARNLMNLQDSLDIEYNALLLFADNNGTLEEEAPVRDALCRKADAVGDLMWHLIEDAFPPPKNTGGYVVLSDWKVAFEAKTEQDIAVEKMMGLFDSLDGDSLKSFFSAVGHSLETKILNRP